MDIRNSIREDYAAGMSINGLHAKYNVCWLTAKKIIGETQYQIPKPYGKERTSKVSQYVPRILEILYDDKAINNEKQHRTAQSIYNTLKKEAKAAGTTLKVKERCIRNIVKKLRKHADMNIRKAFIPLIQNPGEAQLDFGVTDCIHDGDTRRYAHLVISFPYSNVRLSQLVPSQNFECLAYAMRKIFEFIGGVPSVIRFDNMSTAVKKVIYGHADLPDEERRVLTDNFQRLKAHYRFKTQFCGPAKGNQKGSVENAVGWTRDNYLCGMPIVEDLEEFNKQLLNDCWKHACETTHYKFTDELISKRFEADKEEFLKLPEVPFDAVTYHQAKTDNCGIVPFDKNRYGCPAAGAQSKVFVEARAFEISIADETGKVLCKYKRVYDSHVDSINWMLYLPLMIERSASIRNSFLHPLMSKTLSEFIERQPNQGRRQFLMKLQEQIETIPLGEALSQWDKVIQSGTIIDVKSAIGAFGQSSADGVAETTREVHDEAMERLKLMAAQLQQPNLSSSDNSGYDRCLGRM